MTTEDTPTVSFCPMFSEEFPERMLLLKFVEWPDGTMASHRLNHMGMWIEIDLKDPTQIPEEEMALLVDIEVEELNE